MITIDPELTVYPISFQNTDTKVELFLYDVPGNAVLYQGQGKQNELSSVFANFDYLVCIFDVTDRKSYRACTKWIQSMKQYAKNEDNFQIIIVMNKSDLYVEELGTFGINQAACNTGNDEASNFAKDHGYDYFNCSALLNENITEIFTSIAHRALEEFENDTFSIDCPKK